VRGSLESGHFPITHDEEAVEPIGEVTVVVLDLQPWRKMNVRANMSVLFILILSGIMGKI
jgi:hypothetical protein